MDYLKEYKSFINGYYLAEGLRITVGVALPAILFSYLGHQQTGMVIALGAISVTAADIPGPIHHRRNAMFASLLIICFVSLTTGLAAGSAWMLGIVIAIYCFLFSMAGVFGVRVNSIGVSALIIMVLSMGKMTQSSNLLNHTLYLAAGAAWYMLLSMAIYHVRPYKLIQQALGDCIMATGDYFRTRAELYRRGVKFEKVFEELMEQQVAVHKKQDLLRELLFKSRDLIKDSTATGRTLMMTFSDVIDLFEKATTSFYSYQDLHGQFRNDNILERFRKVILFIADELDEVGIAIKSNRTLPPSEEAEIEIEQLRNYFNAFADRHRGPENLEALITLRKILQAIEDVMRRAKTLRQNTSYDNKKLRPMRSPENYKNFVEDTGIEWKVFRDNLSLESNTFRHALRVAIAGSSGYLVSLFLSIGHSYWILLTIIVILKPAYSLTKKRNFERLIGTAAGALLGVLILYTVKDATALLIIMLILMVGTYSFVRMNYLIGVVFMTPYILLLFHFVDPAPVTTIVKDRLLDTGIGSVIAFIANLLLVPAWEKDQIRGYIAESLRRSVDWYREVTKTLYEGPSELLDYKLKRKAAFVAFSNLSEAFSRMLSEPSIKRKNANNIHPYIVLNHSLNGYIASLSHLSRDVSEKYRSPEFKIIADQTSAIIGAAIAALAEHQEGSAAENISSVKTSLDEKVRSLVKTRKEELSAGILDSETRTQLSELKPIADQIAFISTAASDLRALAVRTKI